MRVDPRTQQVVGFSIPEFKAWYAANAEPDGGDSRSTCPPIWPLGGGEGGGEAAA